MNPGIAYAALAYLCWGLFPLYFRQLTDVPALEVVLHRTLWSLVLCWVCWRCGGNGPGWPRCCASPCAGAFAASALLLSANWLTYVWAVNNGHVVDASLGYFILPLVSVALGYFFCMSVRARASGWRWPWQRPGCCG